MFGRRPPPWDPASGRRPSDDQLMELLRASLLENAPQVAAGSTVDHGVLIGRPGWSLLALPNHSGRPGHFDIGFVPAAGGEVIADCISGTGPMEAAVRQTVEIWAGTSGACFRAMVDPSSETPALRLGGADPAGIPGWQTIVSDVIGYGADAGALRAALMERPVLRETAPRLDRPTNNGIKVYLHKTPSATMSEVRVNGVPDVAATQALAALPWPKVSAPTTARFYAVALHRE